MNQNTQPESRPPFVRFEYRPVEDRAATVAKGHFSTKDVAFALITRPGSKDTHEALAEEWLKTMEKKARENLVPASWPEAFKQAFERWKNNEESPVEGTPIKGWPVLGPSAQRTLLQAGFRTVEDLAAAPDPELNSIGAGAIEYRNKARTWLEQANGPGKAVERITALETQLAQQGALIKQLSEANSALKIAESLKKTG